MEVSVVLDIEFHLKSSRNDTSYAFEQGKEENDPPRSSLATENYSHPSPEQEVRQIMAATGD